MLTLALTFIMVICCVLMLHLLISETHKDGHAKELMTFFDWQAASVSLGVGSLVWVEDPELAWLDGEVVEVNGDTIKVASTIGKMVSGSYGIHSWTFLVVGHSFGQLPCNYLPCIILFSCYVPLF